MKKIHVVFVTVAFAITLIAVSCKQSAPAPVEEEKTETAKQEVPASDQVQADTTKAVE